MVSAAVLGREWLSRGSEGEKTIWKNEIFLKCILAHYSPLTAIQRSRGKAAVLIEAGVGLG